MLRAVLQALLALYFFLAGLLVQRHPLLWIMPITSTTFALLHGTVALLASLFSRAYRALGTMARAQFCSAVCRLVYSASVSACALVLLVSAPWMVLPRPSPLQDTVVEAAAAASAAVMGPLKGLADTVAASEGTQALLAAAAAAVQPLQEVWVSAMTAVPEGLSAAALAAKAAVQQAAQQLPQQQQMSLSEEDAWVLLPATLLCCVAAGYYAFRLWRLMRRRSTAPRGVALLRYTLLLLVYGVASYKGSQVALLAVALACEAVGVPAAAGKALDLLAAGQTAAAAGAPPTGVVPRSAGAVRKGLLLLERAMFPVFR